MQVGITAAMEAHGGLCGRRMVEIAVVARAILDLRDAAACARLGVDPSQAAAPWQAVVAGGGEPSSWQVRDGAERAGAAGLIDPSRRSPGLWHLVLFDWTGRSEPSGWRVSAGRSG